MVLVFVLLVAAILGVVLLTVARDCRERKLRALWLQGGQVMDPPEAARPEGGKVGKATQLPKGGPAPMKVEFALGNRREQSLKS